MASHISRASGKLCLFVIAVLGMACFSMSASAANVVAGCDTNVWNAMAAKADAQVAYDTAVTRQMINKPDSVLTLTCFSDAAHVSALQGGNIFSGDFTTQLGTIMPVTGSGTAAACNEIGTLWNNIATAGIQTGAPYATFGELMGNTPPGGTTAGADFKAGWTNAVTAGALGTPSNLATAVTSLPGPPTAFNFANAKSSCDVLYAAGIITTACP